MTDITCSIDGCAKIFDKRFRKGMCSKHYRRVLRTGSPHGTLFEKTCPKCGAEFSTYEGRKKYCSLDCRGGSSVVEICSEEDCGKTLKARGLCQRHYRKLMATLNPCSYEGCENGRAHVSTGFCKTHQSRLEKHGDPSITMKGKAHKVQYTDDGLRICSRCGVPQPDDDFHRDKGGTNGRRAACKECESGIERARYRKDPERHKESARRWREKNLDYARSYDSFRYARDREKRIELATKQSHIRRARLSKVETDSGLTRSALRKRDGDKCYYCHRVMDFSRAVGRKFHDLHATIEHLQPISRGGSHTFDNCVLACRSCNLTKHAGDIEEFVGYRDSDEALFELID